MFIERMLVKRFRHLRDVELGPFRKPAEIGELIVLARAPTEAGRGLPLLASMAVTRFSALLGPIRSISWSCSILRV